jgi:hypothetical protein
MGYRAAEFPKDNEAIGRLLKQIEAILEEQDGRRIDRPELISRSYNTKFQDKEAERLRNQFVRLNQFQESWTPAIKAGSGGFRKIELYDLSEDPTQQADVAQQFPEVTARLKKQLHAINRSVLADAPGWGSHEKTADAPPAGGRREFFARIDANPLPHGYAGKTHQQFVDRRLEAFTPAQRARLGRLWKEKQRLDPDMPNRGASFVRILEFVGAAVE